jgi:anoctamin-10
VISTIRENHKTTIGFNNSVIVKRFIFELINRFFHLWYIAFIEFDLITLKSLLTKLFVMDAFRRVLLESLLPLVMKKNFEREKTKYREELKKKTDLSDDIVERVVELNLWEYDDFDDYIEVIF